MMIHETGVASTPVNQTKKTKVSFPNLDGLRFFCFLSVFFFHSAATNHLEIKSQKLYVFLKYFIAGNGNLGVNFFFVLSGFLITYLLLAEKENYGSINVGNFYIRRVLRIWPLFYFCVTFGFLVFPQLKILMGETPNETASPAYYYSFLNNFDYIKKGPPDSSTLGILWSVAVEEQFYFLWPLLLFFVPRKLYLSLFAGIITTSFIFRIVHADKSVILEHHTLSCISDMTVGGVFAYCSFYKKSFVGAVEKAGKICWIGLYLLIAGVFLFRSEIFDHGRFLTAANRLIVSVLFGLVIIEQNYAAHSFYKMSGSRLFSRLGNYTYGLYCLHMIGILFVAKGLAYIGLNNKIYEVLFLEPGLSLLLTIGLAFLSYHIYEKQFLKLKGKFARITR